ncbi:hypothetical protein A1O1_05490 [Capronia coronata CBS 617.96]|uniref:Uncharacterized protein n=1 Tax=Capronia coronata CBS 617.96 TaxID=1182541 RepID=W9YFW4_9EURO|nr:uncharacterized protein A1O1_05490 [Capronia coronata CBS 617.96]EXJ88560.1 hypothetical protein A1O1_05490 [Capronia coronata CBS 617.96]
MAKLMTFPVFDAIGPLEPYTDPMTMSALDKLCLIPFIDSMRGKIVDAVHNLPGDLKNLPAMPPMVMTGERCYITNLRLLLRYLKHVSKACQRQQADEAVKVLTRWRTLVKRSHDLDEASAEILLKHDDEDFEFLHKKPDTETSSPRSLSAISEASTLHSSPNTSVGGGDRAQGTEDCIIAVDADKMTANTKEQSDDDNESKISENDELAVAHWTALSTAEGCEHVGTNSTRSVSRAGQDSVDNIEQPDMVDAHQHVMDFADEGLEFEFDFDYPLDQPEVKPTAEEPGNNLAMEIHAANVKEHADLTHVFLFPREDGPDAAKGTSSIETTESRNQKVGEPVEHESSNNTATEIHAANVKEHADLTHVFLFPREDGNEGTPNFKVPDSDKQAGCQRLTESSNVEAGVIPEGDENNSIAELHAANIKEHDDLGHVFLFPREDGPEAHEDIDDQHAPAPGVSVVDFAYEQSSDLMPETADGELFDFDSMVVEPAAEEESTLISETTPKLPKVLDLGIVWDAMPEIESDMGDTEAHVEEIDSEPLSSVEKDQVPGSKQVGKTNGSGTLDSKDGEQVDAAKHIEVVGGKEHEETKDAAQVSDANHTAHVEIIDIKPTVTSSEASPEPHWAWTAGFMGLSAGAVVAAVRNPLFASALLFGGIAYAKYRLNQPA